MQEEVWAQTWERIERGRALGRDGYSVHLKKADVQKFIEDNWNPSGGSSPIGVPFKWPIMPGVREKLEASTNGVRVNTEWSIV